jgi:hypothetical protein
MLESRDGHTGRQHRVIRLLIADERAGTRRALSAMLVPKERPFRI